MGRAIFAIAGLALLPETALADCVEPGDLASGIRFVDAEGTVIEHRALNPTTMEVRYDYGGGAGTAEERLFGLHPLVVQELADGVPLPDARFEMTYDGGVEALPRPEAIDTFAVASTMAFDTGATDWVVTYLAEAPGTTELGGCVYQTRVIRVENQGPAHPVQWEHFLVFDDLGVAHLAAAGVGNLTFDMAPVSLEGME
jgi:hypothetical protein